MRNSFLQTTSMIGRVYFTCYRSFFSQFFEVYMVSYGHMVGWTFEYFVSVGKIRTLKVQFVLDLMNLLHLFLTLEERWYTGLTFRNVAACLVDFVGSTILGAVFLPTWLTFILTYFSFIFCHVHFEHPHIGCWLNGHVFYFVQNWLIFVGIFDIGNGGRRSTVSSGLFRNIWLRKTHFFSFFDFNGSFCWFSPPSSDCKRFFGTLDVFPSMFYWNFLGSCIQR